MLGSRESPGSLEEQVFISNYFNIAAIVILFYDYMLTFQDEYERFWCGRRSFTLASCLFYLNRYTALLGHLLGLIASFISFPHMDRLQVRGCIGATLYGELLVTAEMFIVAAISVFRTYVLFGQKVWVVVLLVIIWIIGGSFGMVSIFHVKHLAKFTMADLPSNGCLLPASTDLVKGIAEAWIGALAFEVVVFLLTLYKALTAKIYGSSILYLIIRDGTVYFGVVLLTIISVILSFYVYPTYLHGMNGTLATVLSSTMLSRLMINLRNPDLAFGHALGGETLVSALEFVREEADTSDVAVDRKWVDIEGIA